MLNRSSNASGSDSVGGNCSVWPLLLTVCGTGLAVRIVGLPLSWTADYDREGYKRIQRAIAADPQHLLGRRYDEVSRELRLENVPWDDIAMQRPTGMSRMYHFRGFRMDMTLELLPQGITPSSHEQWNATTEELERHGTLWLAHDPPFVLVDGIQTQKERIERYRKAEDEMCRQMNAGGGPEKARGNSIDVRRALEPHPAEFARQPARGTRRSRDFTNRDTDSRTKALGRPD